MKYLKRYKYSLILLIILCFILLTNNSTGLTAVKNIKASFLQMISILPPIMIILGLIDVWLPREILMKYMGNNSGFIGILLSIALASIAAGPMYAAFPFTAVLIKKGVKFSNIIIFMNAWCVTKISTLIFEISAIGYKFTIARLIINIPGIIIMGYLVQYFLSKSDLDSIYLKTNNK